MTRPVFRQEDRDRVRAHLLARARADSRVIAGAAVGSEAAGREDRWSDLDLTFGLTGAASVSEVLDDWTDDLGRTFGASPLFDLAEGGTTYRVHLLPGNLQVDLSFTPGAVAQFGPRFRLLFGDAVRTESTPSTPPAERFGLGVHHAVRARFSLERSRAWQCAYWVGGVRDQALMLACGRRGLEPSHGRGFDQLPADVLARATTTLARSVDRAELFRALAGSVDLLVREAVEAGEVVPRLEPQLRDLVSPEWP